MNRMRGRGVGATFLALIVPLIATAGSASAAVVMNEVESDGASDYVELFNTGVETGDLSGYQIDDNTDGNRFTIANGATIPGGGYYVAYVEIDVSLGSADSARFYSPADPLNPMDS